MRILASAVILVICASFPAIASETRVGYLMPEACKSRRESSPEEHTTRCALEPECIASGFGLLVDAQFFRFDAKGQEMAKSYFETTKKVDEHKVEVVGDVVGEELRRRDDEAGRALAISTAPKGSRQATSRRCRAAGDSPPVPKRPGT